LQELLGLGCAAADTGERALKEVERDRCGTGDFLSTTNHRTFVRHGQKWIEPRTADDAMVVVREGRASEPASARCSQGDRIGGLRASAVIPESRSADGCIRLHGLMASPRSDRWRPPWPDRGAGAPGHRAVSKKVIVGWGPVVVTTGGVAGLSAAPFRKGLGAGRAERQPRWRA